jgi:hypothetical protein
MQISEKYFTEDWRALKFKDEKEWLKAIDIFYDRLSSRFLKYINKIEKYKYSGFAVMALDCLLIETLQQFSDGVSDNKGHSKRKYIKYLKENFNEFDNDIAEKFYDQFRCGILHQAEIKSSSRIRTNKKLPIVKYSDDGKGLIINRRKFHKKLLEIIDNYVNKLKNPNNIDIREKFRNKMNFICRTNNPQQ